MIEVLERKGGAYKLMDGGEIFWVNEILFKKKYAKLLNVVSSDVNVCHSVQITETCNVESKGDVNINAPPPTSSTKWFGIESYLQHGLFGRHENVT